MNYLVFVISLLALSVVGFFTYGLHSLGPIMITFYRVLFALPFYLVLQSIIIKKDNVNKGMITNQARIYYFCIGMIFGVDISIWVASILYTTIYNSVLLSNLFPIFTVFISRFILKDIVKPFVYIIIAIVSFGVFITVYSDIQVDSKYIFGDILACISAFVYSWYIVGVSYASKKFNVVLYSYIGYGAIFITLVVGLLLEHTYLPQSYTEVGLLLAIAFVGQLIGQGGLIFSLSKISKILVSITLMLEIVLTYLWNYLFLHQSVTLYNIIGGIFIICGISIYNIINARKASV